MFYVHLLKCKDNKTYVGCTKNLRERITRHTNGYIPATSHRRPVKLIYYCALLSKYKAFEFERYLKSASGRAFLKKRLI